MAAYIRQKVEGGLYFFTVNLLDRRSKLLTFHIEKLRASVRKVKTARPFIIHAWVVLPDHLHCIWQLPPKDSDYSTRWRLIKTEFTKQLNVLDRVNRSRQSKQERGIWQRRYWEHCITSELDYQRHLDYVHFNPVKHGHTVRVVDWPYSSFHLWEKKGFYSKD